jgi:hypothetical protein
MTNNERRNPPLPAEQMRQRARGAEPTGRATVEFCRWLATLDDPQDAAGREARRTVTLEQIIDRARVALAVDEEQAR